MPEQPKYFEIVDEKRCSPSLQMDEGNYEWIDNYMSYVLLELKKNSSVWASNQSRGFWHNNMHMKLLRDHVHEI